MAERVSFAALCADLLRSGHAVRFTASGASMGASIRDGDQITVEPIVSNSIRVEDVILYETDRGLTAHRVVELHTEPSTLIARGDAAGSPRERVVPAAVLGRVDSVERDGGWIPGGEPLGSHLTRLALMVLGFVSRVKRRRTK